MINNVLIILCCVLSITAIVLVLIETKNRKDSQEMRIRLNRDNFDRIWNEIYGLQHSVKNLSEISDKISEITDKLSELNKKDIEKLNKDINDYKESINNIFYNYSNEVMYAKTDISELNARIESLENLINKK